MIEVKNIFPSQSGLKMSFKEENKDSPIWKHFLHCKELELAKCKKCDKEMKCKGRSTSAMRAHLKAKYDIDLSMIKISAEKTKKFPKIDHFFKAEKDSLSVILSELVVCDGIPVRVLSKSQQIRDALGAHGYKVPADANAIRAIIMKQGVEIKTLFKKQFHLRNLNRHFSLTLDNTLLCKIDVT